MGYGSIMETASPTLFQTTDHRLALPAPDLAETVRAKLLADLGEVEVERTKGRRIKRPRAELLAEAVDGATFAVVMDWISSTRRGSIHTKRAYVDDIRRWAAFCDALGLGRFRLGVLTPGQVRIWRLAEETRLTNRGTPIDKRTIRRRLSALSSLHAYAAAKDVGLGPNPVTEDDMPKAERGRSSRSTPVLEEEHVYALARHAADDRERLVVVLLYILAGRVSEMCEANVAALRTGPRGAPALDLTRKEDKKRLLTVPEPAATLLLAHTAGRDPAAPLLLDAAGGRLDRHDAKRLLARLGRHAGVLPGRAVTPHVMRASRITHMLDAGVPLEEVQAYADHNDPATTVGYRERRRAAQRNAALARAGARLFGDLPPAGHALPVPDGA